MILACPFCKAKADPAAVQCGSCGKTMSRACPACAETIASTSTTCKYCGEAVPAMKEPAPVRSTPPVVFIDEKPGRKCCGSGRSVFWILVLALAAFCAYSAVKTRVHLKALHEQQQQQQKISNPPRSY